LLSLAFLLVFPALLAASPLDSMTKAASNDVSGLVNVISAPGSPLAAEPGSASVPQRNAVAPAITSDNAAPATGVSPSAATPAGGTPFRIEMTTTIVTTVEPQFPVTIGWADLTDAKVTSGSASHRSLGPLPLNGGILIWTCAGLLMSFGLFAYLKGARQAGQARA